MPIFRPTPESQEKSQAAEGLAWLENIELPLNRAIYNRAKSVISTYGQRIVAKTIKAELAFMGDREFAYSATDWVIDSAQLTEEQQISFRLTRGMQHDLTAFKEMREGGYEHWLYEDRDEFGLWMKVQLNNSPTPTQSVTTESLLARIGLGHTFMYKGKLIQEPQEPGGRWPYRGLPGVHKPMTTFEQLRNRPAVESTSDFFVSVSDTLKLIEVEVQKTGIRYIGIVATNYKPQPAFGTWQTVLEGKD